MDANKELLKKRAEKLSKITEIPNTSINKIEIIPFNLGFEQFALETKFVKEVSFLREYTSIPCAPPFLFGVTNIRRKILPIINLKYFFSIPSIENNEKKILIISHEDISFALLIDGFSASCVISLETLQTELPTLTGIRYDFLKGVTLDGIVILDGEKLVRSPHLIINENVES